MRVRHEHFRALRYCNRGARKWLEQRGVAWADFLAGGVDAQWMRDTGDAMAIAAVEHAERQAAMAGPHKKRGGCV